MDGMTLRLSRVCQVVWFAQFLTAHWLFWTVFCLIAVAVDSARAVIYAVIDLAKETLA
jgi:hypothetical protein